MINRLAAARPLASKQADQPASPPARLRDTMFNWASSAPVFPGRQVAAQPPADQPPAAQPQGLAAQAGQQARGALDWLGKNSPLMPTYQRSGSQLYTLPEPKDSYWAGTTGGLARTQDNPVQVTATPAGLGVSPQDMGGLGYTPVEGQAGTYRRVYDPVSLSPQSRGLLAAASQGTWLGAKGRVADTVKQGIKNMGVMDKIRGPRAYFGPIRQNIHDLTARAQEFERAGRHDLARPLYRQAGFLTEAVTKGEPQAEARMAPVRAWATAGIGAMGLLFLLFKLFGGRR